jgi:lipopolysaccharide/colanic/teichoic acid biosynthesis glycosyltransferase
MVVIGRALAEAMGAEARSATVVDDVPDEEIVAPHVYVDQSLLAASAIRPRTLTKAPLTIVDSGTGTPVRPPLPLWARALKRTVDVVAATIALAILAVPMLVIGLIVRRDSPGSAIFRQERIGTDGRSFHILKFRTMVADNDHSEYQRYREAFIEGRAELHGELYKDRNDPRVTRLGAKLRAWSLDELPQLWNVLKGDMSLIGPRPCLPYEADRFDVASWDRLRVKPGITGLWQVSGRSSLSHAQAIALDVQYWQQWSLGTELRIFLRTPVAILAKTGV